MAELSGPPAIEVRNLNVFPGPSHALQGVDLTLGSGVISVVGRNGDEPDSHAQRLHSGGPGGLGHG